MGVPVDGYYAAMVFFLILQWVAALGRCAIRIFIVRKFGLDDVAMLVTLLVSSAYFGCFIAITELTNGGQADWNIDIKNLFPAINTTLGMLVLYILGTMMLKVALGLLLLRVLVKRWQVLTIYVCMAVSVIYGIFYFFFVLFECGPPKKFAITIIAGQCLSVPAINAIGYTHGVIIAITDLVFAVLPVALIKNTDISKRSKISVVVILSLGSIGCICTFVRLGYIHDLSKATATFFETSKPIALLSGAELSIGITCLSLSCYKPLIRKWFWNHDTYYYEENSIGPPWHGSYRNSGQPLQQLSSYQPTVSTLSPPLSRHGTPHVTPHRYNSRLDHQDWPMKAPIKYSSDADSRVMSPVSPISPVKY